MQGDILVVSHNKLTIIRSEYDDANTMMQTSIERCRLPILCPLQYDILFQPSDVTLMSTFHETKNLFKLKLNLKVICN